MNSHLPSPRYRLRLNGDDRSGMTLEDLGNLGEFVGAIAVVALLLPTPPLRRSPRTPRNSGKPSKDRAPADDSPEFAD